MTTTGCSTPWYFPGTSEPRRKPPTVAASPNGSAMRAASSGPPTSVSASETAAAAPQAAKWLASKGGAGLPLGTGTTGVFTASRIMTVTCAGDHEGRERGGAAVPRPSLPPGPPQGLR